MERWQEGGMETARDGESEKTKNERRPEGPWDVQVDLNRIERRWG